jgi:hypothetical protein
MKSGGAESAGKRISWTIVSMRTTSHLELDDEQRARVIDCLQKDGLQLAPAAAAAYLSDIGRSIEIFLEARGAPRTTSREAYNALRGIWELAHDDDCPVGQLRARIQSLPMEAVEYLDRRARRVIPNLFPKQSAEAGFVEWARNATGEDLVIATQVLSAEGGQLISRSRGGGKRSAARPQPRILGRVSGSGEGAFVGGRPRHVAQGELILNLALDWIRATDCEPSPGRSDQCGFGDLVHSVFQWLDESAPDQALRRYWTEVQEGKACSAKKADKTSF